MTENSNLEEPPQHAINLKMRASMPTISASISPAIVMGATTSSNSLLGSKGEVQGEPLGRRRRILVAYDCSEESDFVAQWTLDNLLVSRSDHVVLLTLDGPGLLTGLFNVNAPKPASKSTRNSFDMGSIQKGKSTLTNVDNSNIPTIISQNDSYVATRTRFSLSEDTVRDAADLRHGYIEALQIALAAICTHRDISVQKFLLESTYAGRDRAIVDLAERTRCHMIVVGSSGNEHSKLHRMFRGSVSMNVAEKANVPILVVKHSLTANTSGRPALNRRNSTFKSDVAAGPSNIQLSSSRRTSISSRTNGADWLDLKDVAVAEYGNSISRKTRVYAALEE